MLLPIMQLFWCFQAFSSALSRALSGQSNKDEKEVVGCCRDWSEQGTGVTDCQAPCWAIGSRLQPECPDMQVVSCRQAGLAGQELS